MNLRRIRWTLTGWYVAVLLGIVLLMSGAVYLWIGHVLRSELDNSLSDSATRLASQVTEESVEASHLAGSGSGASDLTELNYLTGAGGDVFYAVFSPQGTPLANPLNAQLSDVVDQGALRDAANTGAAWRTVKLSGKEYRLKYVAARQDDQTIAIVAAGRTLTEQHNELRSILVVLVVISTVGLVLALIGGLYVAGRALAPAEWAMDRQQAFIADASHELRSPLTLIKANAEVVQRSAGAGLSPQDQEALGDILVETDRMAGLVNELLLLARLDEGGPGQAFETVDIGDLLPEAVRLTRASIGSRDIEISAGKIPERLTTHGDADQIMRVLRVLLDNAVRYTPDGGHIRVAAQKDDGQIQVSVSDTGPGLAPEDLDAVFERFYRADKIRSRESGGFGLGLAIARGVVEAHGGKIWAESPDRRGATFSFTLPLVD